VSDDPFLSRWSRLKHEAKRDKPAAETQPAPSAAVPAPAPADELPAPQPLPPVESLTPESDFTPFMKPDVDASTRRQALKALFRDPQFNVMDGLDVYIDDYSRPDPLPDGWLEKMNQFARLGDHLLSRENEPEEPPAGSAADHAVPSPAPSLEEPAPPQAFDTGGGVTPRPPVGESGA